MNLTTKNTKLTWPNSKSYLYSPVQNCLKRIKRHKLIQLESTNKTLDTSIQQEVKKCQLNLKFSAVLGAISAKSSILILPAGMVPMVMSKNTTGFLGFGGRTCHSTPAFAAITSPSFRSDSELPCWSQDRSGEASALDLPSTERFHRVSGSQLLGPNSSPLVVIELGPIT